MSSTSGTTAGNLAGNVVFLGTLTKLEASRRLRSRANWMVEMKVDKVLSGAFRGETFSFRVHNPARSGLEVGKQYTVRAVRTDEGYAVDPLQWRGR